MKKKKLEAKLKKTKKKLASTKNELDAMLAIIDQSGMPKASAEPFAGTDTTEPAKAAAKKPVAKKASARKHAAKTMK